MFRRIVLVITIGSLLLLGIACKHNKKPSNPLAQIDSKQPDTVLFAKAVEATSHGKYETARLNLQTLINAYPDSEYVARAKLAIGDSWLKQGGAAGLTQAESEYKDFITFFPNMPEAAEAQMKIADIHFKQIGKPDRDFDHTKHAEEEYRQLLLQYPDSKLAETARIKLLQVQEILAEREYRIGHFYYMRESWPAAMARLKTLTDTYPLFSKADDALFILGDAYERQVQKLRVAKLPKESEDAKNKLIGQYMDAAAVAYSRIITRYPVTPRASDAAKRLAAIGRPVPKPTQDAIDLNRREQASRGELRRTGKVLLAVHKRPDYSPATKVGAPTLVDPRPTDAAQIVRYANDLVQAPRQAKQASDAVTVGAVTGANVANSPMPRSSQPAQTQSTDAPAPAPPQTNEANASDPAAAGNQSQNDSSSKPNKSGLRKLMPF
ncbi:MAG: outer membrane protein assembly factor BamD [Candidatus Korobacteraceae bacterium]|jgi:outer membrane protein assembly factor BamD